MITKGTEVSFVIQGRCVTILTTMAGDVRQDVNDALGARGWKVWSSVVQALTNERLGDWDYRAEVRCSSSADHARIEDMIAVVRAVFWEAAGSMPTVSAKGYTTQGEQPAPHTLLDLSGLGGWVKGLGAGAILALVVVGLLVFHKRV
jgi:hypothetical protein